MSQTLSCSEARVLGFPVPHQSITGHREDMTSQALPVRQLPAAKDTPLEKGVSVSHKQPIPAVAGR